MDSRAVLLSGCDEGPCFPINNVWVATVFLVLIAPTTIFLAPYVAFRMLQEAGRVKLSMEPVVCTGLGLAAASPAAPPSFNVTLRAKSTYGLLRLCTSGPAAMEVAYSGTTIAMADVGPFCIEPRGEKVITATASPGWPALPSRNAWRATGGTAGSAWRWASGSRMNKRYGGRGAAPLWVTTRLHRAMFTSSRVASS